MESQSLSSRARATLRQGEPALPREQSFGGAGRSLPGVATPPDMMRDRAGGSGMMAGATSQISQQVSQRPWTSLAIALAAGYAVGSMTGGSSSSGTSSSTGMYYDASHDRGSWDFEHRTSMARGEYPGAVSDTSTYQASSTNGGSRQSQAPQPGMFSQLTSQFDDQIGTLKDTLLSSLLGLVHDTIQQDAPSLYQEMERVRRERGGQSAAGWAASTTSGSAQTDRSKDPFRKEHEQETY